MQRSRVYHRKMRAKHIKMKKNIVSHWKWWADNNYSYYPHDGMYSKNKIHCSCSLCKEKARHNGKHTPTIQERRKFYPINNEDLILYEV